MKSIPTINDLPDLCLLNIYDHLTIVDLLTQIPLVSKRFHSLAKTACFRRRQLALIINHSSKIDYTKLFTYRFKRIPYESSIVNGPSNNNVEERMICHSTIRLNELNSNIIKHIRNLFPNITKLYLASIIQFAIVIETNYLIDLLCSTGWNRQLTYLNVRLYYQNDFYYWSEGNENEQDVIRNEYQDQLRSAISEQLYRLIPILNLMIRLRYLSLNYSNYFNGDHTYRNGTISTINLPILGQLVEFYFHSFDHPRILYQSLKEYANQNENLRWLGITNDSYRMNEQMDYFTEYQHQSIDKLFEKFTRTSMIHFPVILLYSKNKLLQFINITSLTIKQHRYMAQTEPGLTMITLASLLEPLKCLQHLRVTEFVTNLCPLSKDDNRQCLISRLTSIKILEFDFSGISHLDCHSNYFGWIFPSVEILQVRYLHWRCSVCRFPDLIANVSEKMQAKCFRRLVEPWWMQCEMLHTIYAYVPAHDQYRPMFKNSKLIHQSSGKKYCRTQWMTFMERIKNVIIN